MKTTFPVVLFAFVLLGATSAAAGPAVSTPNGKVEAGIAWQGSLTSPYLAGSYDLPLGEHFGFQADALAGHVQDGKNYWGLGGQFFWRDPDVALFGIGAARLEYSFLKVDHLQVDTEWYFDDFTISAQGARDYISIFSLSLGHLNTGSASVGWYPDDNLLLQVGGQFQKYASSALVHAEWQPETDVKGLTLFADVNRDSHSTGLMVGLRLYFGGDDKSLKRRHREDDPPPSFLASSLLDGALVQPLIRSYILDQVQGFYGEGFGSSRIWQATMVRTSSLQNKGQLGLVVGDCFRGIVKSVATQELPDTASVDMAICASVLEKSAMNDLCSKYYAMPDPPGSRTGASSLGRQTCTEYTGTNYLTPPV